MTIGYQINPGNFPLIDLVGPITSGPLSPAPARNFSRLQTACSQGGIEVLFATTYKILHATSLHRTENTCGDLDVQHRERP
jgi:hypothetical protein